MTRRARVKKCLPPSTAIERLEQGRLSADDLRLAARLLGRPDLDQAADALVSAQEMIQEFDLDRSRRRRAKRQSTPRQTGPTSHDLPRSPVVPSDGATPPRGQSTRPRAATRPAGPSEVTP